MDLTDNYRIAGLAHESLRANTTLMKGLKKPATYVMGYTEGYIRGATDAVDKVTALLQSKED